MYRSLVLDANILIRAVLGPRVREIIERYHASVRLVAPIVTLEDPYSYLPAILKKRGLPADSAIEILNRLPELIEFVNIDSYSATEQIARLRLGRRDPDDWPIVALAITLDCPVWTEDQDFFGTGLPTWTTETVEIFLRLPDA